MTQFPRIPFRAAFGALLAFTAGGDAATAVNAAPLAPYEAEYEVLRNGKPVGHGSVSFRRVDAATWELLATTRGTAGLASLAGLEIVERSSVRWSDGRPESIDYQYRQDAGWSTRERSVQFEPGANRIVSHDRRGEHVFAFAPGVLDRQAVALALAQDLLKGRRDGLSYTVVDRDELGQQRYRVDGEEEVDVPAGRTRALRVERLRDNGRGRSTTSWLGIERQFVPVRVLQREPDGDSTEMRLMSLRIGSPEPG
jgi:hypothetical protein